MDMNANECELNLMNCGDGCCCCSFKFEVKSFFWHNTEKIFLNSVFYGKRRILRHLVVIIYTEIANYCWNSHKHNLKETILLTFILRPLKLSSIFIEQISLPTTIFSFPSSNFLRLFHISDPLSLLLCYFFCHLLFF